MDAKERRRIEKVDETLYRRTHAHTHVQRIRHQADGGGRSLLRAAAHLAALLNINGLLFTLSASSPKHNTVYSILIISLSLHTERAHVDCCKSFCDGEFFTNYLVANGTSVLD